MTRHFLLIALLSAYTNLFSQQLVVTNLQCEHKTNPIGIGNAIPHFSWQLQSPLRGIVQMACRILVSDNEASLQKNIGNIWDSKKMTTNNSTNVIYKGISIKSAGNYYWKAQVWDNKGNVSWSEPAMFTTGLFSANDWGNAKWIGYESMPDSLITFPGVHGPDIKKKLGATKLKERTIIPIFRKTFMANKVVKNATVFISGLGQYELSFNGKKIGDRFLAPGWTNYNKTVLYNTYNVTNHIQAGENVIAVMVGNGFYNINRERYVKFAIAYGYPKLICKTIITYTDSTTTTVVSDASWKTTKSPITFTSIYGGENYDANLEIPNWNNVMVNEENWKQAMVVAAPLGKLIAEMDYPVTVKDTLLHQSISKSNDSVYIYDFGQNLSGIISMQVQGKKGQVVKLFPAELLNKNKLANQNATGKPYYFTYTLKGTGIETWQPTFTYTGFRYVQVQGASPISNGDTTDAAKIIAIQSLHTSNASPQNGSFECSNKLFNDINNLIKWSIKSNLQSVVTDCPHREKLSWLEQDYLMGGSINANYNVYHLYKKLVSDMMDAQTTEGLVPDIAPDCVNLEENVVGYRDSPEWGSAAVLVPWMLYKWYGDKDVLQQAYPMMQRYVGYLKSKSNNNILNYGLGDWFDNGPLKPGVSQLTPKALTATAIYFFVVKKMAAIAMLLDKKNDVLFYDKLALQIKNSFAQKFYNPTTKIFATGSQTAMAMPLCVGLVDDKDRADVVQNLKDSIVANQYKLTAGDIGFHFLIQALQDADASELIYKMNDRDDVPGYGYQLKKGATSLTESWAALEEVSNNHLMLGHIMQWFYEGLAGINQANDAIGYHKITIKPAVVGDINFVKANHQTNYGNIVCNWKKSGNEFNLMLEIPANTSATVYLPAKKTDSIVENNLPINNNTAVVFKGFEKDRAIFEVGSGNYSFLIKSK